jgi:phosphate transport system substrate-binding protein
MGAFALAGTLAVAAGQNAKDLTGSIKVDGSSTVYPITEAVAEEFSAVAPKVRVTVGVSGTGGGFKRFYAGETDISDASRPIKADEARHCADGKIDFIELPIAYDGLTVVVNPANEWVYELSIDDIKKIFVDSPTKAKTWRDVRSDWPDRPIKIYAPGTDSGTFDYFKEVVAAEKNSAIRSDMSVSEDDNILVRGVAGDQGAIGFFGCAYYFENKDKVKAVPIVNASTKKAVLPSPDAIESGEYAPFSRPLFIYVNRKSAERPEVRAFVDFYLQNASRLAAEVGYVSLPADIYARSAANFKSLKTGTQFLNDKGEKISGPVTKVYK